MLLNRRQTQENKQLNKNNVHQKIPSISPLLNASNTSSEVLKKEYLTWRNEAKR